MIILSLRCVLLFALLVELLLLVIALWSWLPDALEIASGNLFFNYRGQGFRTGSDPVLGHRYYWRRVALRTGVQTYNHAENSTRSCRRNTTGLEAQFTNRLSAPHS